MAVGGLCALAECTISPTWATGVLPALRMRTPRLVPLAVQAALPHSRGSLVPCRSQEPPQDSVIATYEEHEDSVYAVDWSSADPWLFASLSYDGRLVINRVPRALKYHILL